MATPKQIKLIHVLKGKLGWNNEAYRGALSGFGVDSSKELSFSDAEQFLAVLSDHAHKAGIDWKTKTTRLSARFDDLGDRPGFASPKQLRHIEALWVSVSNQETLQKKQQALVKFISNRFGILRLEWIEAEQVSKIVKAISSMKYHQNHKEAAHA